MFRLQRVGFTSERHVDINADVEHGLTNQHHRYRNHRV